MCFWVHISAANLRKNSSFFNVFIHIWLADWIKNSNCDLFLDFLDFQILWQNLYFLGQIRFLSFWVHIDFEEWKTNRNFQDCYLYCTCRMGVKYKNKHCVNGWNFVFFGSILLSEWIIIQVYDGEKNTPLINYKHLFYQFCKSDMNQNITKRWIFASFLHTNMNHKW